MNTSSESLKTEFPQRVYISYTTKDLASCKDVVEKALDKINVLATITPSGTARDISTVDACYRDIQACDIFIGLVGYRYGWIPEHTSNPDKRSIIELEYLHARALGKHCLMFIGEDPVDIDKHVDIDRTNINRYRQFLQSGDKHSPRTFSCRNAEFLGTEVLAAIEQLRNDIASSGKTHSGDLQPVIPLTDEQQQFKHNLILSKDVTEAEIDVVYNSLSTPRTAEAWLLKRWAHWSRKIPGIHTSPGQLHSTFVNLQLQLQSDDLRPLDPTFEKLESESKGERTVLYQQLDHALNINSQNRPLWVLLGPPGAGKTTVLQHYEQTCIVRALEQMEAGHTEKPELCVWIRLSTYKPAGNDACPEPQEWLEKQWKSENPDMPSLAELSAHFRLRYLLDGLNEIPAPVRDNATEIWSDWVEQCRIAGHILPPIFSVRRHEYNPKLALPNDVATEVELRLWQSSEIEEYLNQQIGADSPLAEQILADNKLIEFYGLPLNLYHLCELYRSPKFKEFVLAEARTLLYHRGRLYVGMLWLRLQRLLEKTGYQQKLIKADLLTSRIALQLSESQSEFQSLRHLLEKCPLVGTLKAQALRMQRQGTQISVDEHLVAPELSPESRAVLIDVLEAMRIAEIFNTDQFRFVHQQWQEFFAALALVETAPDTTLDFKDKSVNSLKSFDSVWSNLSTGEALSPAPVGRWAETARLLLELSNDKSGWFVCMAEQNPPLAAFAAEPVKEELPAKLSDSLRMELLTQMVNPNTDLRQRLLCGHAVPMIGDPRYLEKTSANGTRYLIPAVDRFVSVPAGEYQLGSTDGEENEHCNGQLPQIVLSTYQLAFAPVTNAEYACFVEAGGYTDDRWWLADGALEWRNGEFENSDGKDWERELRQEFQELGQDEFQRQRQLTDNQLDLWRSALDVADDEFNQWLISLYDAPGIAFTEPEQWRNHYFNQAPQPVVGVCWYEASAYCEWLGSQSGQSVRLPTEAEWEVASRGISRHEYPWGNSEPGDLQINSDVAHLRRTSPVGVFESGNTPDGLTDMAGNVFEWCYDWYGGYQPGPVRNPTGPTDGGARVLRGGGWIGLARHCRSACRDSDVPSFRDFDVGFRFAQVNRPRKR